MKSKKLFLLLSLLVCVTTFLSFGYIAYSEEPQETQELKPAQKITEIVIKGNKSVSTNTVTSKIKIRTGDAFSQKAVNEDIKRLYATGFFTDVSAESEGYKDGIKLIFNVVEKSAIEKITFEGNKVYKEDRKKRDREQRKGCLKYKKTFRGRKKAQVIL